MLLQRSQVYPVVSRHLDCIVMVWVPGHGRLCVHVHAGPQSERRIAADLHTCQSPGHIKSPSIVCRLHWLVAWAAAAMLTWATAALWFLSSELLNACDGGRQNQRGEQRPYMQSVRGCARAFSSASKRGGEECGGVGAGAGAGIQAGRSGNSRLARTARVDWNVALQRLSSSGWDPCANCQLHSSTAPCMMPAHSSLTCLPGEGVREDVQVIRKACSQKTDA